MAKNQRADELITGIEDNLKKLDSYINELHVLHTEKDKVKKFVFELVHDVGKCAAYLKELYQISLRKRKENGEYCPATKNFGEVTKILDKVMERGCRFYQKEFDE